MAAGVAMARSEKILDVEGASMLHLRELQVLCTSGECQNMSKAVQRRTDRSLQRTDVCLSFCLSGTRIKWYDHIFGVNQPVEICACPHMRRTDLFNLVQSHVRTNK